MKYAKFYFVIALMIFSLNNISGDIIQVPKDYSTIQAAINEAAAGDTVLVAEGTYYENLAIIGKAITLASEFILDGKATHISKTIIDGSQPVNPMAGSVVFLTGIPNSNATIKGFTITGGTGTFISAYNRYYGGAILVMNNGAIIEHNIIKENSIEQANASFPGIGSGFFTSATLIIRHNKIMRNSTIASDITAGGGVGVLILSEGVTIKISDNIISDNSLTNTEGISALGGGIEIETEHSFGPDIEINNNIITGNELHSETSMGGGIYFEFWEGNPIETSDLQLKIFNNLIADNYSQDKGGGLAIFTMGGITQPGFEYSIEAQIMNNTLIDNRASDGSGVFAYDVNLLLLNNILWDKTDGENCREIFQDYLPEVHFRSDLIWPEDTNDGTLHLYNNCIKGGEDELQGMWFGENNIEAYPKVNPALFKLIPKSPCLGAGAESVQIEEEWYYAPDFDYYDNPRPDIETGLVDMGAVMSDDLRRVGLHNQYGWKAIKEVKLRSASLVKESPTAEEYLENESGTVLISPNPITTTAVVRVDNGAPISSVELVDVTGKVLQVYDDIQDNSALIDRAGLEKGIYLLRIDVGDVIVKKVVIE